MSAKEFFNWWGEQLAGLIPERWYDSRPSGNQPQLELVLNDNRMEVSWRKGDRSEPLIELDCQADDEELRRRLDQALLNRRRPLRQILLHYPPGQFLIRDVDLPLAAAEDLSQALSFQIERLTPFDPKQIHFGYGIRQRDTANQRLRAWLLIARRQPFERVLRLLGLADETPRMPRREPDPDQPLELELSLTNNQGSMWVKAFWLVFFLNLLAGAAVLVAQVRQQQQTLTGLREQQAELLQAATEVRNLEDLIEQFQAERAAIAAARPKAASSLLLEELSRRLSDDTWLTRLELHTDGIELHGISFQSTAILKALEDSAFFANPRFESSVTRDPVSGGDRFYISADLQASDASLADLSEPMPTETNDPPPSPSATEPPAQSEPVALEQDS